MLCRPLRGTSSCFMTGQAPRPMWIRHAVNCLPRRVISSSNHRQEPSSFSTSEELCTRVGMSGAWLWFLHQHWPVTFSIDLAWTRTNDYRCTSPTTLPEASKVCQESVSCKCKKGCTKQCNWKQAKLECTPLCDCEKCSDNWTCPITELNLLLRMTLLCNKHTCVT